MLFSVAGTTVRKSAPCRNIRRGAVAAVDDPARRVTRGEAMALEPQSLVHVHDGEVSRADRGVGEGDQLLDSVEFFSLGEERTWRELSPLKVPRTEHGKGMKYLRLSSYEELCKIYG